VAALEPEERDVLRRIRESALPSLYGLRGHSRPVPVVEDVSVPPDQLIPYVRRVQELLQSHETTASFLVRPEAGQVDARPFLDLEKAEDVAKLWAIADQVHGLALELGGTVSSQHGTGLARTPWVARQAGKLYPVFRDLKTIFDPRQIFNPGKIVSLDPPLRPWPLRRRMVLPERTPGELDAEPAGPAPLGKLSWEPATVRDETANCNGCGECRTAASSQRMCPIFRVTYDEAATPRAKANLMRHILQKDAPPRLIASDDVRSVADLCVNCKMCAVECPAHVQIPRMMLMAKAANVAEYGLDRWNWVLARTESFAAFGSAFAFLVNRALASRSARWLLEKLLGISRKRRLPAFAGRSFLTRARRRGWTKAPRPHRQRVAYFVDVFANYNDPQIAEAVVAVLHHNGIEVYVPPEQTACGMAPLAQGDVETARESAQSNLRVFAELAREGYPIICSEPTAALMLAQDYLDLLDDSDARLVADNTVELTSFLWDLHRHGKLNTGFRALPITVGHHVPCHLKALGRSSAGPALLSLIPALRVRTIDVSCSGMAGTFGLKAANYDVSLRAGSPMLAMLSGAEIDYGSTECSTCRLQMEDGGGKRTLHPVQYMALAYGLMPELSRRLREPIGELVLR
jgi:Fe-S oxidoreductase